MTDKPWALIALVSILLLAIGATLGDWYCDYRTQQLTHITQQIANVDSMCISSLTEVTRAAVIFARNQPQVALSPQVRDSLRNRRWTTP